MKKDLKMLSKIITEISSCGNEKAALHHLSFFKTGKGEYGEGDKFYGATTPDLRNIAKKYYKEISFEDLKQLITNEYHENRLCAVFMLTYKYPKSDIKDKKKIVDFYLAHTPHINNWDLVDVSTHKIIGAYCSEINDFDIIYKLANSNFLWEERIAVVANWTIVKTGNIDVILTLSKQFLNHKHDLMHKAVGWMLREMGKSSPNGYKALLSHLDMYGKEMPRMMLRYSIEKLNPELRQEYLKK